MKVDKYRPQRALTYVAFDGDADMDGYQRIKRWSTDPRVPFEFRDAHDLNYANDSSLPKSIINQLRKRMNLSANVVLIVSDITAQNRKGILEWEIRYALRHELPIICAFCGYATARYSQCLWENELWPRLPEVLRETHEPCYCLVAPFTQKRVVDALKRFDCHHLPPLGYTPWW